MKGREKKRSMGVLVIEEHQFLCAMLRFEVYALKQQLEHFNVELIALEMALEKTIENVRKGQVIPFPSRVN